MKLYLNGITPVSADKVYKPKMSCHRGRTWDEGCVYIDGVKYAAFTDTTWGMNIYIQYGSELNWYKIKLFSSWDDEYQYDIDPFTYGLKSSNTFTVTKQDNQLYQ
jgi:hypothetical protein